MAGDGRRPETIATIQKATMIHGEDRTARPLRVLTTNVDDRLPIASLGRGEGGDGFVEGRDVADVRPQSSVPHPLDDLTQLGTIGLDNEVDRQAVGGPYLGWAGDGHQCSSGSNQIATTKPIVTIATDTRSLKLEDFSEMWPDANHELSAFLRPEEATDMIHPLLK